MLENLSKEELIQRCIKAEQHFCALNERLSLSSTRLGVFIETYMRKIDPYYCELKSYEHNSMVNYDG